MHGQQNIKIFNGRVYCLPYCDTRLASTRTQNPKGRSLQFFKLSHLLAIYGLK